MASPGFLDAMQPAIDNYVSAPVDPSTLNYSPANLPVPEAPAGPLVSQAPPPSPAPSPLDGGFSPAPPAPMDLASTPAPSPAPAAPPAPPQPPRTVVMRGAGSPQHEVLTKGQTALAYENKAEQDRLGGVQAQEEAAKSAALHQAMAASVRQDEADERVRQAAAAAAAQQKSLTEANDKVHAATEATKNIAPITDYWADRSTFQHIGSSIMIGLAGIGQAISGDHGENPAMKNLQNAMDMDLRTKQLRFQQQSAGLSAKKDEAQQHFDNMVKQFGMEPATQIQAAAQRDKVAAQIDSDAAATKSESAIANGAKMSADIRAEANDRRAQAVKLIQASGGSDTYIDPEIGIPMTRKEIAEYRQKKALEGQQQGGRVELAGMKATSPEKVQEGTRFIAEKMQTADIPGTLSAIDAASSQLKKGNDAGIDMFSRGIYNHGEAGRRAYAALHGPEAAQREQDWGALSSQIMHTLTGAGMSAEERGRYEAMLDGAGTAEARTHAIGEARKAIIAKQKNIFAGAGAQAAEQYQADVAAQTPGAGANPTTGIVETPVK